MIKITIERRQADDAIIAFQAEGHAHFADYGNDIVCAGVSAVTFGTVNAIMKLTECKPEVKMKESGWFAMRLPESAKDRWPQIQLLLESMVVMLETIQASYGDHVQIIIKGG